MRETIKKFFYAGIGCNHSVFQWMDKEVEKMAKEGEKANDRVSSFFKEVYDLADKKIQDGPSLPFLRRGRSCREDSIINALKNEIQMLREEISELKKDNHT